MTSYKTDAPTKQAGVPYTAADYMAVDLVRQIAADPSITSDPVKLASVLLNMEKIFAPQLKADLATLILETEVEATRQCCKWFSSSFAKKK